MPAIRSLGLHKPAALSYLIEEGLLPEDCSTELYSWEIFEKDGNIDELISTRTHVVWSGGSSVYRIFSFDVENEPVKQALFAYFPIQQLGPAKSTTTTPQLKLPKRQAKNLPSIAVLDGQKSSSKPTTDLLQPQLERAIVVVLQSHAQVFFLSGTRSIIPLSFDVERAFPLCEGVLFQRKRPSLVSQKGQNLPPKTPINSFALTQPLNFSPSASNPVQPFVKTLFDAVITGHKVQTRANVPFHYYLSDLFSDPGVVASEDESRSFDDDPSLFEQSERVVYLSSRSEAVSQGPSHGSDPLQFAVTANVRKQTLAIWQVSRPTAKTYWKPNKRATSYEEERKRRRRSSQPGTGAVTPNARQSMNPRESFGGPADSFINRDKVLDDGDLAAQLDPAFQNPRAPGQSSRRISSMLARSNLASMDIAGEGALPPPGAGSRRGPSIGGVSKSLRGPSGGVRDLRSSLRSDTDGAGGHFAGDADDDDAGEAKVQLSELLSAKGLTVGLQFTHVISHPLDPSIAESVQAFTISSTRPADNYDEITFCVTDRSSGQLLLVKIEAGWRNETWHVRHTGVSQADGIVDACLFRSDQGHQVAMLSRDTQEAFNITLQSAHATIFKVPVPIKPLINFPFSLRGAVSPKSKRTTGPRRLIDDVPYPLTALHTGAGNGQIIVTDNADTRHVFEMKVSPQSRFVDECLHICETAWKPPKSKVQRFFHGWRDIVQFLSVHANKPSDTEWTGFVVLIFVLCCALKPSRQPQTPLRTKRKSGGLLRSSSGASADLDGLHSDMLSKFQGHTARQNWFDSPAWKWAAQSALRQGLSDGIGLGLHDSNQVETQKSRKNLSFVVECIQHAREYLKTEASSNFLENFKIFASGEHLTSARTQLTRTLLAALHLFREEVKLDLLSSEDSLRLCPVLAQLGGWLGWKSWSWNAESFYMTEDLSMSRYSFEEWSGSTLPAYQIPEPPSILQFVTEHFEAGSEGSAVRFPTLADLTDVDEKTDALSSKRLVRISKLQQLLAHGKSRAPKLLAQMHSLRIDHGFLESLPEGIAAALRSAVTESQAGIIAPNGIGVGLLDREDIELLDDPQAQIHALPRGSANLQGHSSSRDHHAICRTTLETDSAHVSKTDTSAEMDRLAVTRLMFKDDHRVAEAQKLLHPLDPPTVRCAREPEWSEQDLLEAEQELAKVVAIRTLSVSAGRGLLQFGARNPLLTERFPTHGFTLSCIMKPSNNSITAEKETFTEEKVSWAFFHAGAEAGLSISRNSKGINTSWIIFNRPTDLNNRHAGFLLALGLNGHLKHIAKWVAFKYLTPKHTMTSVGLLLGLAASYLGTMDTLITRLLSVHVTRMLPPGAAELNLSPLTQTTGILALGLLYCETQHRRMTEVMLSEIENAQEDVDESPLTNLRDEGYRLAAGFALGMINLGQGKTLRGLYDMHIVERLLGLAVSTKPVELMHILDKATAGATVAIALIFMKTEDEALARKVDIPETSHQFEYIRPDVFLLRTVARHLIMWSRIRPTHEWIRQSLPPAFEEAEDLNDILMLDIKDLPLYNTLAGLCLAIGLRYAGSANPAAHTVLLRYLDQFMRLTRLPALTYDHRLTRTTVRNCQDVIALATATVMAGTGDIELFRRLRSLHGRTDPDTPYGSHLAAHQAIGVLFLAGGTHTFKTTNLAVASLLCAFYPLFPSAVLDNKGHLQAFRHLWVLATEPRCLIVRDMESHKPISMPIKIKLKSGEIRDAAAPCLLPELDTISSVSLADPRYWLLTLDFTRPAHREAFDRHQSIFAARKRVQDPTDSPFVAAMQFQALAQELTVGHGQGQESREGFEWIFDLPSFAKFSDQDKTSALPENGSVATHVAMRTTSVDDRLVLRKALDVKSASELWNLRALFAWAENAGQREDERFGWLEREVVASLKAELGLLIAQIEGET